MNLKPYHDIDEHDVVVGLFSLNTATGSKATPVIIQGSGTNTNAAIGIGYNLAPARLVNVYSPRWAVAARVRQAVSGEKPFGVTLYDTLEVNQWNYPLIYDKMRREELQATVSGQSVNILRKGTITVGPLPSGVTPDATTNRYAVVRTTGDWGTTNSYTGAAGNINASIFGEYLGPKDTDGYVIVTINCYV